MSDLGFLERLLDGASVEWKPLENVAELKRGTSITKKAIKPGTIPVIAGGRSPAYFHSESNRDGQTIVVAGSGANAGFVTWWDQPIFVSDAFSVNPFSGVLPRYCFHWLQSLQRKIHELKSSGGIPHVYPRDVAPFKIPIPCPEDPEKSLAIQAEIVRILDSFTELTAELTAELKARTQQYNHYREQLLCFEDGEVEWKTLGEVAEYSKTRIRSDQLDGSNYVGVDNLLQNRAGRTDSIHVPSFGNLTEYREGDVLIGNIRPYLRKIWLADRTGGTNGDVLVVHTTDNIVNSRYLFQVLSGEKFFNYNIKHSKGAKMPRGSKPLILQYPIPIPCPEDPEKSRAEQARIVAILDKFDTLTTSLSEGLPREIKLRQQQYEYYRDLLLSFPKPGEAA